MNIYKFPIKHGLYNSHKAEYRCWQNMIQRCHNPSNSAYHLYGARGIFVCDRWRDSVENFIADMGERPDGMSLDRINNNGSYSPHNCRWATTKMQNRNHRGCVFIEYLGKRQTIIEWSEETGIDHRTIHSRYKKGFLPEQIFNPDKFIQHQPKINSKSGLLGASPYKNKWKSQIKINGVVKYLGLFETAKEASNVYMNERAKLREKNT